MSTEKIKGRSEQKPVSVPFGPLGIVSLAGEESFVKEVDDYLEKWRAERDDLEKDHLLFTGYERESYIIGSKTPRFGSGEGRACSRNPSAATICISFRT